METWLASTDYRKVILAADEKEWAKLEKGVWTFTAVDLGLTEVEPNTETVMGFWPMPKSAAPKCLARLQTLKLSDFQGTTPLEAEVARLRGLIETASRACASSISRDHSKALLDLSTAYYGSGT